MILGKSVLISIPLLFTIVKFSDNKINEITKTILKVKNESFISSGTLLINPGKFVFIKENRTADRIGTRNIHPSMLKFILNDLNSLNYKIGLIFFLLVCMASFNR